MSTFPIHTIETAPEQSNAVLRQLQQTFGFIPNIAGAMAGSPVLIDAFIGLFQKRACGHIHRSANPDPVADQCGHQRLFVGGCISHRACAERGA